MLVAIYAAAGIGAIVIGVSLFTGAMEDKGGTQPAKKTSASATVEPPSSPTPAPVSTPTAAERAEATKLKQAYDDQRAAVLGQETRAVHKVQTAARKARAARRRAAAKRRRAAARRRAESSPAPRATPTPTAPTYTPPASSGGAAEAGRRWWRRRWRLRVLHRLRPARGSTACPAATSPTACASPRRTPARRA